MAHFLRAATVEKLHFNRGAQLAQLLRASELALDGSLVRVAVQLSGSRPGQGMSGTLDLERLIERIYEAPGSSNAWRDAMSMLADMTQFHVCMLIHLEQAEQLFLADCT